jgi:hypothetical protein
MSENGCAVVDNVRSSVRPTQRWNVVAYANRNGSCIRCMVQPDFGATFERRPIIEGTPEGVGRGRYNVVRHRRMGTMAHTETPRSQLVFAAILGNQE